LDKDSAHVLFPEQGEPPIQIIPSNFSSFTVFESS
jgi:hypothetical protein